MDKRRSVEQYPTTVFGFATFLRLRRNPALGINAVELVDEAGNCYYSFRTSRSMELETREVTGSAALEVIEAWISRSFRARPVPFVFSRPSGSARG